MDPLDPLHGPLGGPWLGHAFAGNFWPFDFPGISTILVFQWSEQVQYNYPGFDINNIAKPKPKLPK